MRYPSSNPNLRLNILIKALFKTKERAALSIENYFSKLTGKKYIIITNSCRTALYLTYNALNTVGEVITSPLTCKVAIDPIIESNNVPVYADINPEDLNILPKDIEYKITDKTIAIQTIHLGGVACDMERILKIAKKNNILIIEDCAQSLGSIYQGKNTGSFGDVSCFSLIKNAYGIGGGVLATDSSAIYERAFNLNKKLQKTNFKLILFRIIRNLISTKRKNFIGSLLYNLLMRAKGNKHNYHTIKNQLYRISSLELKIAALQIDRYNIFHQKRKNLGLEYYKTLCKMGIMENCKFESQFSSFTKYFVYNPDINSKKSIQYLNSKGIEAMHLEEKAGCQYQEKIIAEETALKSGLINYLKVHDSIVSLPISESFVKKDLQYIMDNLKSSIIINQKVQ